MSRTFGPIVQNGYVVDDLDAAVTHWIERLGVGPFFLLPPLRFERCAFRGVATDPVLHIAVANSGGLQIELIEQVNAAPSAHREFLETHGPGLQHVSVWSEDYDDDLARHTAAGHRVLQDATIPGGVRLTYFDTGLHGGAVMEMLELHDRGRAMMAEIRDAAIGWDGRDPRRTLSATTRPTT
ncbi:VOC family protein [Sphingomonas sp.]|uniref:VOC family protein n=1 Tax=Sphingomonas sp. TaxID=28214 RepID=UPI002D1205A1|nr:VOC family protein [Sphingomonas sp.]HWK35438.1 VOC family protein [Sphingomonas sp.]